MSRPTPSLVYIESLVVGRTDEEIARMKAALKALPYLEYLQSDYWKLIRKCAIEQFGGRCQRCRKPDRQIDVHHSRYLNRGEEYRHLDDLKILCHECHMDAHFLRGSLEIAIGRQPARDFFEHFPKRIKDVAFIKRMPGQTRGGTPVAHDRQVKNDEEPKEKVRAIWRPNPHCTNCYGSGVVVVSDGGQGTAQRCSCWRQMERATA